MKKTFIVLLSLLLVFGATAFALTAAAEGPIPKITASGEYVYSDTGDTITWSLDHGVLTVGSTGAIGGSDVPWNQYSSYILKVIIEEGVTSVLSSCFSNRSYQEIILPQSLQTIGERAFYRTSVGSFVIPEATTSIAEDAFEDFLVSSLQVAPGNPVYHSDGNCLIVTAEKRMMINGRSCTIPADGSVTTIGGECFYLYNTEALTLPKCITKIENGAFMLSDITDVYYDGTEEEYRTIQGLDSGLMIGRCFVHFTALETQPIIASGYCGAEGDGTNVSWTMDSTGRTIFTGSGKMGAFSSSRKKDLIVGEGITSISGDMYDYRFVSISLPSSLESIGDGVFSHNKWLQTITIPADSNLKTIGRGAFATAFPLKGFTIPNGVTTIEPYTFDQTHIRYVVIPKNVTTIKIGAFRWCGDLLDVYYAGSEEEWNAITIDSDNDPLLNATIHYNMADHTPADPVKENVIPATCTTLGRYDSVIYCTDCGCELSRRQYQPSATNHPNYAPVEKELPTATKPGHEAGIQCVDCGHWLSGGEVIAPLADHWGYCGGEGDGTNLVWTLDSEGTLTISGTGAMANYSDSEPAPWSDCFAAPGASITVVLEEGVTTIGTKAFPNTGLNELIVLNKDCDLTALEIRDPAVLRGYLNSTAMTYANEHDLMSVFMPLCETDYRHTVEIIEGVDSTCKEPGHTPGLYCVECGKAFYGNETLPLENHTWGALFFTDAATTETEGVRTRTCAVCDAKETQTIEKLTSTGNGGSDSSNDDGGFFGWLQRAMKGLVAWFQKLLRFFSK